MTAEWMNCEQKRALWEVHRKLEAKMMGFGGWEMPLHYGSIIDEHLAVRSSVGLFDISHLGRIAVDGADAEQFLMKLLAADVRKLKDNSSAYSLLLNESGGILDDLLVYRHGASEFVLVVNAACTKSDYRWACECAAEFDDLHVEDCSGEVCALALQGPQSRDMLSGLCGKGVAELSRNHFSRAVIADCQVTVSCTGYTGEDGFEIFCSPQDAVKLFNLLTSPAGEFKVQPCGLGARDTLRLEMGYPLCGSDIDETTNPVEAGLLWSVKMKDDRQFVGRQAIESRKETGGAKRLVGFVTDGHRIARRGWTIRADDSRLGRVTSGSYSPCLEKGIGMGYVKQDAATEGDVVHMEGEEHSVEATLTKPPFIQPTSTPKSS